MSCTILKTKTQSPGWHRAVWRHTSCSPSDARNLSESLCKCSTFVFQQSHGERKTVPLRCHQNNPQEDCLVTGSTTTCWHWHIKKREIKIDLTAEIQNNRASLLTALTRSLDATSSDVLYLLVQQWSQFSAQLSQMHLDTSLQHYVIPEPKWDSEYGMHHITEIFLRSFLFSFVSVVG